jgi:hypothetical protein
VAWWDRFYEQESGSHNLLERYAAGAVRGKWQLLLTTESGDLDSFQPAGCKLRVIP